jgi:hypothetical protein
MAKFYISVNQLAEFSEATESGKKKILKQQKAPNRLLIPWYQRAKGAIKRFFTNTKDYSPIEAAIQELEGRVPENDRQKNDRNVSIQALETMKKIKLPKLLSSLKYELITASEKDILINDVDVKVAPEIIIKAKYKEQTIYGAIKIHISKGKPFNHGQASYVATLVYQHITKKVAGKNDKVLPELCFCLDVFAERLVPAPENQIKEITAIKRICDEVKVFWPS